MKELVAIQTELKAPKKQFNKNFGGYNYRKVEDILEAVKPLLKKYGCALVISDELVFTADDRITETVNGNITQKTAESGWHYIKATATIMNEKGEAVSASGFAREEYDKKGNDVSQLTGAASTYARKYALNGLLALDDTDDADTTNTGETKSRKAAPSQPQAVAQTQTAPAPAPQPQTAPIPTPAPVQVNVSGAELQTALTEIGNAKTKEDLTAVWTKYKAQFGKDESFRNAFKNSPANPKNAAK